MRLNPHEKVLKFESLAKPGVKEVKRSKNGCFNCRKRKKKCDEFRPNCSTCSSKGLECIWPKGPKDKLPDGYQIPKTSISLEKENFIPVVFDYGVQTVSESPYLNHSSTSKGEKLEIEVGDTADTPGSVSESVDSTDENYSLDLENASRPIYKSGTSILNYFTYDPEQNFLMVCVNGFIDSVGPQYTHPLLTTTATFSPFVTMNPIIQKVATACGCAFLSYQNPDLNGLASQKYRTAFNSLKLYLKDHNESSLDNWVGAAFQLLCLCTKVTSNVSSSESVLSLANSYKIIKARFSTKGSNPKRLTSSSKDINSLRNQNVEYDIGDFKSDNLKMEIENSQLIEIDKDAVYFDSHFEKMFVESFIYNYCVALLVSENYQLLPNPFDVFKDLRYYLKKPLFSCDVAWMNNPVFGAALDAYELACKASYLFRNLNDPLMLVSAKKLYDIACFYPSPMIPSEIRVGSKKYRDLKESVSMAEIVAKVAKILLRKLIMPEITEYDPVIQKDLNTVISKFGSISLGSKVKIIAPFPAMVAGTACVNDSQREVIVEALRDSSRITHGRHIYTVLDALDTCWGRGPESNKIKTRGLNILFDNRIMSKVIL